MNNHPPSQFYISFVHGPDKEHGGDYLMKDFIFANSFKDAEKMLKKKHGNALKRVVNIESLKSDYIFPNKEE